MKSSWPTAVTHMHDYAFMRVRVQDNLIAVNLFEAQALNPPTPPAVPALLRFLGFFFFFLIMLPQKLTVGFELWIIPDRKTPMPVPVTAMGADCRLKYSTHTHTMPH